MVADSKTLRNFDFQKLNYTRVTSYLMSISARVAGSVMFSASASSAEKRLGSRTTPLRASFGIGLGVLCLRLKSVVRVELLRGGDG
jgi:hypothetical protein